MGHVEKRKGAQLPNFETEWKGKKLYNGKTLGGIGRLTKGRIDSLKNYYGDDNIRRNCDDIKGLMRAVQASLLHCNFQTRPHDIVCAPWERIHGANGKKPGLMGESSITENLLYQMLLLPFLSQHTKPLEARSCSSDVYKDTPKTLTNRFMLQSGKSALRKCF